MVYGFGFLLGFRLYEGIYRTSAKAMRVLYRHDEDFYEGSTKAFGSFRPSGLRWRVMSFGLSGV